MSEILLTKTPQGSLIPAMESEVEKLKRFKVGAIIRADVAQMRNYEYHKKWFSLVTLAFDAWTETAPGLEYKGIPVERNFKRFRKDVTILAGYYTPVYDVRGNIHLEAKSISFSSMSQEEFESLFSKTIDVILKHILPKGRYTEKELRDTVEMVMGYA